MDQKAQYIGEHQTPSDDSSPSIWIEVLAAGVRHQYPQDGLEELTGEAPDNGVCVSV